LARRHVARAAWANAGMGVPPGGGPCRLSRCRQGDVPDLGHANISQLLIVYTEETRFRLYRERH
jgi:hypothetical protein